MRFLLDRLRTEIHLPSLLAEKQLVPAKVQNASAHLTSARSEQQGHQFRGTLLVIYITLAAVCACGREMHFAYTTS